MAEYNQINIAYGSARVAYNGNTSSTYVAATRGPRQKRRRLVAFSR